MTCGEDSPGGGLTCTRHVESEGDVDVIADQLGLPPDDGVSANYDRRGGAWLNGRRYLVGVFTGRTS